MKKFFIFCLIALSVGAVVGCADDQTSSATTTSTTMAPADAKDMHSR